MITYLYSGVATGALYALIGLAITLVYGLTKTINFAVGELVMIGAFATWSVHEATGSYPLAFIVAVVVLAVVGFGLDLLLFRHTRRSPMAGFIVSLGLVLVLQNVVVLLYTSDIQRIPSSAIEGTFTVGDDVLTKQVGLNALLAFGVLAVFFLVLQRTWYGRALRSTADDPEAAALVGVRVDAINTATFVVGAAIAGAVGWMVVATGASFTPYLGANYVIRGFAVALCGGLGNVRGAAIAGVGLGIVESFAVGYLDPAWTQFYVFTIVIAVLLWRPTGLARGAEGAHI